MGLLLAGATHAENACAHGTLTSVVCKHPPKLQSLTSLGLIFGTLGLALLDNYYVRYGCCNITFSLHNYHGQKHLTMTINTAKSLAQYQTK